TVICPGCRRAIVLPAEDVVLLAITCVRCETVFTPAEHLAPLAAAPPEPTGQCWQCGAVLPLASLTRRDVTTGRTSSYTWGQSLTVAGGARTGRVNVCRRCAAELDRRQRQTAATIVGCGVLAVLVLAALALWLWQSYVAAPARQQQAEVEQQR